MNISAPSTPVAPPKAPVSTPPAEPKPPQDPPVEHGNALRDVAAIGAGAVAGTAGAVFGLGEGLIRGGIHAYPKHIRQGAKIGRGVSTPLGKVVGGAGAVGLVGVAVIAAPALTVLAAAGGAVNGTLLGAYVHGQTEVPKAIDAGAKWGASTFSSALRAAGGAIGGTVAALAVLPTILYPPVGKELIPQAFAKGKEWGGKAGAAGGGLLGTGLGTVGGALVGGAISTYKGLPNGYETGKEAGKEAAKLITDLPAFAKDAWAAGYTGGGKLAGDVGGVTGGTVGFVTATGATVFAGVNTSIERASSWAGTAHSVVKGKAPESVKPAEEAPKTEAKAPSAAETPSS